ncbi:uncharacterized protein LOC143020671 isoform X2 [Oratosquilla oratoria]|uniref:uncharacterized protein LOC143020671 isoform X2 n=1 Tax=Oratosquilla oratoria TaxID=337810 RepID=UPI003F763DBF
MALQKAMADPIFVAAPTAPIQVGLNISDVIDIIGHDDPEYESTMSIYEGVHGGGAPSEAISTLSGLSRSDPEVEMKRRAYVKIIEQPQAKALRFRYICEGRSAGSIPGVRSTAENKTYPAIQVHGYKGPAVVVVSCVTMDPPYRPHPHNLVGKEGCKKGVCTMNINNDSMQCIFSNLGIQCVKKKDVEDALRVREEIRVDPFQTGFGHRNQTQSIDLNALRLCFQVFLEGSEKGKFTLPLKAVVSDPIYDKKATSDLVICKLSDCSSSAAGGKEIILLCDKVTKEDIQVKFYEVKDGMIAWESLGDFQASDVHKQVAISFKTPRYKSLEIENPVKVYIQLLRPSDKSTSEPRPFEYLPLDSGRPFRSFKRLKNNYGLFQRILGVDSPVSNVVEEDMLKRKDPSQKSPSKQLSVLFPDTCLDDVKPLTPQELKLPHPFAPPPVSSATSKSQVPQTMSHVNISTAPTSSVSPASASKSTVSQPSSFSVSSSSDQSVDDIKQRLTATLERKKAGGGGAMSPNLFASKLLHPKSSPFWSDDASVYSDADMLDEVLSQGSINDLLSAVGEGFTVYEDVDMVPDSTNSSQATDAIFGDASYASCYSNLEFVMGQAKSASMASNTSSKAGEGAPALPPKKHSQASTAKEEDFSIYGSPSGKPIHPNKRSLLLERGFLSSKGSQSSSQEGGQSQKDSKIVAKSKTEWETLYGQGDSGVGIEDLDNLWDVPEDEPLSVVQEKTHDELPKTVLDLFV